MRSIFCITFCFFSIFSYINTSLEKEINTISFNSFPVELPEIIIRNYTKNIDDIIFLKKLRLVSKRFDYICSKIFVEKIDVDSKLFMPWYIQMQLHFCEDQSLKGLFTSFNHESTIFNMLTSKFFFVSNLPKSMLSNNSALKDFCKEKFNLVPDISLPREDNLETDIANAIGTINHYFYIENCNKKHSLVDFDFKNYQYISTKLPENIYLYIAEIIKNSFDYSLSFTIADGNDFEAHQEEKKKIYTELMSDIIDKLNQQPNPLIRNLKNISISFLISHEEFKKIKKILPQTTFIHTHNQQESKYQKSKIQSYFSNNPENRGLTYIYLEYKLATKQLDYNESLNNNLKDIGQVINFLIEKNDKGLYKQKILDLLEYIQTLQSKLEYIQTLQSKDELNYIFSELMNKALSENNYNTELIVKHAENKQIDKIEFFKRILQSKHSLEIKKRWIENIKLRLTFYEYLQICRETKESYPSIFKKLNFTRKLCRWLSAPTLSANIFFKEKRSLDDVDYFPMLYVALGIINGILQHVFVSAIFSGLSFRLFPNYNVPFLLRRLFLMLGLPLNYSDPCWKYWQKDVIIKETK